MLCEVLPPLSSSSTKGILLLGLKYPWRILLRIIGRKGFFFRIITNGDGGYAMSCDTTSRQPGTAENKDDDGTSRQQIISQEGVPPIVVDQHHDALALRPSNPDASMWVKKVRDMTDR